MKKIFTLILVASTLLGFAQAPSTSAGAPTQMASDVISVFSDGYTDVAGTNFNPNWGQATAYSAFDLAGDNMLKYATLNYQGIEFGSDINAAAKGTLHMDIWSDKTADVAIFCISRSSGEKSVTKTLTANQWTTVDIDLTEFISQGMSMADLFQFKFDETARTIAPSIYIDNIYFYGTATATEPLLKAVDPTQPTANVSSIYSESYVNPAAINYYPGWGQATQFAYFAIGEDSMLRYSSLNYQGMEFGETLDLSTMEYIHMDVWTSSVDSLDIYPISISSGEKSARAGLSKSSWTSIDIPLSTFTDQGLSMSDIHQIKIVDPNNQSGTIFVDNVYFYVVPVPMMAAAAPTRSQDDVISVYSEEYTNPSAINLYPGWGQATRFQVYEIGEDSMIEYSRLNYQGIEFGETIDASGMDTLHLDVWSTSVSTLDIFPISAGTGEKSVSKALEVNSWNSIDIPLADYTSQSLSMSDLIQFKFVDPDGNNGTIYLDNIYFFKEATSSVSTLTFKSLNVYPNPASGTLNIKVNAQGTISDISLLNIQGQSVKTLNVENSIINTSFDVSELSSGVYFLKLNSDQGSYTHRVIIQ